jgi:hypothetical protein
MKKLIVLLIAFAAFAVAAEMEVTVRSDGGGVVATFTITTTNEVLLKLEDWRMAQLNPDETLKYPTRESALKALMIGPFREILKRYQATAAIQVEKDKITAAEAEVKRLAEQDVQ